MKYLALILLLLASPAWATVYYVDGVDGNDGNAGTSEGSGNAWATIDNAMNNVVAGDSVFIKGNGDYAEMATMDTAGSASAHIHFEGYTTTPGDDGMATIDATGLNNGIYNGGGGTTPYYTFENIAVENADFHGWNIASGYRCTYTNCQANNNTQHGFNIGGNSFFTNCSASGNGSGGSYDGFYTGSYNVFLGCFAYNNSSGGFNYSGTVSTYFACIAKGNADEGFRAGTGNLYMNCVVDGDGKTTTYGIDATNAYTRGCSIYNCIFYDCGTGLRGPSVSIDDVFGGHNLFYANTTDSTDWPSRNQVGDVSGDPAFTDEANDDYSLGTGSAALNAGWDYIGSSDGMDIGAVQMEDAGSSGGIVIVG